MSRFFVGCPVRKVRGESALGATGRVTQLFVQDGDFDGQVVLAKSALNKITGQEFMPGERAWVILSQWEPIQPTGHQPATQSHEQLMADLRKGVIHA